MKSLVKGTTVTIEAMGLVITGKVVIANYWDGLGWDIEFDEANVRGGYGRWKQWQDGGHLIW